MNAGALRRRARRRLLRRRAARRDGRALRRASVCSCWPRSASACVAVLARHATRLRRDAARPSRTLPDRGPARRADAAPSARDRRRLHVRRGRRARRGGAGSTTARSTASCCASRRRRWRRSTTRLRLAAPYAYTSLPVRARHARRRRAARRPGRALSCCSAAARSGARRPGAGGTGRVVPRAAVR